VQILYYISIPLYLIFVMIVFLFLVITIFREDKLRWKNPKLSEKTQAIVIGISRLICVGMSVLIILYSVPYFKDTFLLIKRDISEIEGTVIRIDHKYKRTIEEVYLNGESINFFIDSKTEVGKSYRISYLPNTRTGIEISEIQ